MNNQDYYTPSIEDFRMDYEGEQKVQGEWVPFIIDRVNKLNSILSIYKEVYMDGKAIRTPYLTKEQIEKEGWVEDIDHPIFSGSLSIKNDKATYWLRMIDKTNIRIIRYTKPDHNNIWKMQQRSTIYDGDCPSINEFRQITKLLNIK